MQHLEVNTFNDADRRLLSAEIFNLTISLNQELESTTVTLCDMIGEDHSCYDPAVQKVILHIGNVTSSEAMFYDYSKIPKVDGIDDFINASFNEDGVVRRAEHDPRPSVDPQNNAPGLHPSFFERSFFNIKKNLKNVFELARKRPLGQQLPKMPDPSVTVKIDLTTFSIDLNAKKVMILWNTIFFNAMLTFINQTKAELTAVVNRLLSVNKEEKQAEKLRKLLTMGRRRRQGIENPIRRRSTIGDSSRNIKSTLKETETEAKKEPQEEPKKFVSSTMKIAVQKIIFFNFNKRFFQTEILLDGLELFVETLEKRRTVRMLNRSLMINDLTGYPFTRRPHELKDISNVRRSLIVQIKVPTDMTTTEAIVRDPELLNTFHDYSLVVSTEILVPEMATLSPEKVKTTANVAINNLQVNFYMQAIFRLIDLININILPFLIPETFPTDREEIKKRMTDFFQTRYTVRLYNTAVFLKPNYLYDHYIQMRIIELMIANQINKEDGIRDFSTQKRSFYTESIVINASRLFWGGYQAAKESTMSAGLKIVFTRFLFQREVREFYGSEDFLKTVNFANDIKITGESLHLSLFRNDFLFFMILLFNNINFDDQRSKDYQTEEVPVEAFVQPMALRVDVRELYVYFRYDGKEEQPKVWAVFELPMFEVNFIKNKENVKDITISAEYVKASAFEVTKEFQEDLLAVSFIEPILKPDDLQTTKDDFGIELIKDVNAEDERERRRQFNRNLTLLARNNTLIIQPQTVLKSEKSEKKNDAPRRVLVGYDTFFIEHEDLTTKALFVMKVKVDTKGTNVKIQFKRHNILLMQSVFFKLIEFTRMTDEMSINMKMQPLLESGSSNLEFTLSLQDTTVSLPHDPTRHVDPIKVKIGKCVTTYNKYQRAYSVEMENRLRAFNRSPVSGESGVVDNPLSIFTNSYNLEKFMIFENPMGVTLEGVHIFTTDESRLDIVLDTISNPNSHPNFGDSCFTVAVPGRGTRLRFIAYDLSISYQMNTIFSNNYRTLSLAKGALGNKNLTFAVSSYDIDYFTNLNSALAKFNVDKLEFDNSAQTETETILLDNFGLNRNDYFYSKAIVPYKQRKVLEIDSLMLKLLLLDDAYGTMDPLIDVTFKVQPTAQYKTHTYDDYIKIEAALEASYLNPTIRVWEPIFENMAVEVIRSYVERNNRSKMSIRTSSQNVCLNVSTAMLDLVTSVQTNIAEGKKVKAREADFEQSMYHVSNQTGRILEVWVAYPDGQVARLVIKDGQTRKIQSLTRLAQRRGSLKTGSLEIFAVELEDQIDIKTNEPVGRLKEFTINGQKVVCEKRIDGQVMYHAPTDDFFNQVIQMEAERRSVLEKSRLSGRQITKDLLISVSNPLSYFKTRPIERNGHLFFRTFENTQMVLKICTRYLITNESDLKLIVRLMKDDVLYHIELPPHSHVNIPIEFENGSFCVAERNFTGVIPDFSEQVDLNVNDMAQAASAAKANDKDKAGGKGGNQPDPEEDQQMTSFREFWIHFEKRYMLVKVKTNAIRHEFVLSPSLILENRTFRRFFITDIDGQGFECMLKKHDIDYNAYFQIRDSINLRFKFANLESEEFKIKRDELLKRPTDFKFWLLSPEGWPMVKIYIHVPKGDTLRLIFYHKNILLNETFRNWWFSQSLRFREIRNVILQPQIGDTPQILFVKHKTPLMFAAENNVGSRVKLDVSKAGPTFYESKTVDGKLYEFTVTLESRKVSEHAEITQKIVHFVPKYVFINRTKSSVVVADNVKNDQVEVKAQGRTSISFAAGPKGEHQLLLKFPESEWSEPIPYTSTAFFFFSIRSSKQSKLFLVNLEINFSNNSYYIILLESEYGSCCFENLSKNYNLLVYQDAAMLPQEPWDLQVAPGEKSYYAWRYPLKQTNEIYVAVMETNMLRLAGTFSIKLIRSTTRQTIKLPAGEYFIDTFQKGFTKQIQFMPIEATHSNEFLKPLGPINRTYLYIDQLGISVIYGKRLERRELVYCHFNNLFFKQIYTERQTEFNIFIDFFSIDFNAKRHAVFPVLFTAKHKAKVLNGKALKFLKAIVIKKNDSLNLNVLENLSVEVHPCVLKLEEDLLVHCIKMYNEINEYALVRNDFFGRKFPHEPEKFNVTKSLRQNWRLVEIEDTRSLFFQKVYLSTIEIVCSFRKSLQARQDNTNLITYMNIQNSIGAFLINVDEMPLTLPDVRLGRDSKSLPVLKEAVIERYKTILFNTVFKFIASSNLLGNPLSFYNELKLGFNDLIQKESGTHKQKGLVGGTESFMKHVVIGTSGAVNKFTRTVGDGLGALTTDNEYLLQRERMFQKSENKFLVGLKQLGFGIYDALKGVFVRPVEGAQKAGFSGAMKGTYQGLSGLVLKPVTGMMDLASATAEGVKDLFDTKKDKSLDTRRRLPRPFYTNKRFYKHYEMDDAQYTEMTVSKEGYQMILVEDVNFNIERLIVCLEGVLLIDDKDIVWRMPIEQIVGVICRDQLLTIEFFEVQQNQIVQDTRKIDYNGEDSGRRIQKAIDYAIENFNAKTKEVEDEDSVMSVSVISIDLDKN